MKKYDISFWVAALALTFAPSSVLAHTVYVSPKGHDANRGTKAAPLSSVAAARDALRAGGKLGKEPCAVILEAGIYRLAEPLRFTPQDSGAEGAEVVYLAAEGADVTLTGALSLKLNWKPWKDGIYQAKLESEQTVDQLFINGTRQVMARYPNAGAGKAVPFDGYSADAWDHTVRGWKNPVGAFFHGMHKSRWGGTHYQVTGLQDGKLITEGGWMENRAGTPHKEYRMAENIFEELDAPGEWFYHLDKQTLYYVPENGTDLAAATAEAVFEVPHLIEIYGDTQLPMPTMKITTLGNGMKELIVETPVTTQPVQHIQFKGIHFTGTTRTFMQTKEPLLRSDWTIYRGGAVHLRGTEQVSISECRFDQLGGNAVFVDGYNRGTVIRSNYFDHNGASDVNFVGSPAAVRDPIFKYEPLPPSLETIDTEVGPKTDEYPADCLVEDNLMGFCGRVEKQPAGVNIAMASRITVRHNTIHHTPRSAINIGTGTWGGHLIEGNDCFETVLETHDHGAFNSWGRDRYWFRASPNGPRDKELMRQYVEKYPDIMLWDAYQKTVIRNNRMQCDHGWDIDLDDGSTYYEIYNNLCLSGGLKTREGFYRNVHNNIIIGGPYTCNVPYEAPVYDQFERNILVGGFYSSRKPATWKGTLDYNLFHAPDVPTAPASAVQNFSRQDARSLIGDALFVDPGQGDFTVKPDSPALTLGFQNFSMTDFGVTSESLKRLAPKPPIKLPTEYWASKQAKGNPSKASKTVFFGAEVDNLDTQDELTAYGSSALSGVILVDVPEGSRLEKWGFQTDDVILKINGNGISTIADLKKTFRMKNAIKILILRGQVEETISCTP